MQLVLVGSIAYDDISSEAGSEVGLLGGSATYAGLAAAFHYRRRGHTTPLPIGLVGVVGQDFAQSDWALLQESGLNLDGVERAPGLTFHWKGSYEGAMAEAETHATHLNVFGDFVPHLPSGWNSPRVTFCANIHPQTQAAVLQQTSDSDFTALDSMNLWIELENELLSAVLREVDLAILNDGEVRQLAADSNLLRAGRAVISGKGLWGGTKQGSGPSMLIIKRGEHGVLAITPNGLIALPAYPTEDVVDPTGCGDTFAGTLLAHLAMQNGDWNHLANLRMSLLHATVTASFTLGDFGTTGLTSLRGDRYQHRLEHYLEITGI
jgi:hypothetical protein